MTLSTGNGHPIEIKRQVMVVNEEGVLKDLPHNPLATVIAGRPIVGDVLICNRSQI